MTGPITISGYSDDLIYVEGAVTEEIRANYEEPTTVTVGPWEFEVEYNKRGEWTITVTDSPTDELHQKWPVGGNPGFNDYTEVVQFPGPEQYEVDSE